MNVIPYRVLALARARKLVKDDLRAKGTKPSSVKKADLDILARLYVELHPDLIRIAREDIDKLVLAGEFGKKGQRALRANINSDAQPPTQPISATSAVCEMIVGYARVSTDGQTLDAQHQALTAKD